jgi:DNA-binding NtrC family response regulator
VLVVCEPPAVRLLIQQTLEHAGCTAIAAENCRTAMVLGSIDPPQLILLDEKTVGGDADGFQALVDKYPAAIIAALAAPVRSRTQGVAGADCLIEKPVEEGRLLRAVAWSLQLQDDVDDRAHGA